MNSRTRHLFVHNGLLEWRDDYGFVSLVPIIYEEEFNGGKVIVVLWYDTDREKQYEFHLCVSIKQIEDQCAANVDSFRVIFLGQLKDFPKDSPFHERIFRKFQGKAEKWIIFAVGTAGLGYDEGGFVIPVHFTTEVIMNAESGRLIRPETYSEPDVWTWAMSRLNHTRDMNPDDAFSLALAGRVYESFSLSDFNRFIYKEKEKIKAGK